jgi:HAD superfamily hydrolase (TIGR01509 family)
MIEAVIFDMDGLILDSEIIESQALIKFLIENGKTPELNPNGLVHDIGGAGEDYYVKFKTKYQLPHDTLEIRDQKRIYFEQLISKGELKTYDGFYELLEELKKNKFKLAVASNRFIGHVNLILETLEVADNFDVIVGPSETRRHKPHPDIYLETAKLLEVKPENCLALEDTAKGVTAANAAGIKVIAVPNEYTKEHDFSKADKVVKSLKSVTIELINSI